MKKKIVTLSAIGVLFLSCSTPSEDYAVAAKELCKCMEENGNEGSFDPLVKVNLGACLLDAQVDLKDPKMLKAVEAECPEIKGGFEEFINGMR